jgi:hypothetical protein
MMCTVRQMKKKRKKNRKHNRKKGGTVTHTRGIYVKNNEKREQRGERRTTWETYRDRHEGHVDRLRKKM